MATECAVNADRFKRFFDELETRGAVLTTIAQLHKTLADHFASLEQSLSQKSQALDSEIEAFDVQTKKTLESLENRENTLPERESAAAASVGEQKDAAIADIEKKEGGGKEERSLSNSLRMYFRRMDSKGLMRFLLAKRKESGVLRSVIAAAVEDAVDLMTLVLDAVEEFLKMKVEGKGGMADRRRACGMLIQAAMPLGEQGSCRGAVARSVRERAVAVLEKWKGAEGGSGDRDAGGMGAGEAAMFLQMVAGFGLKERFEEEFLRKLVVEHSARRDIPKVAVLLGFKDKMKDIIDELVKRGKQVDAVYFAFESGLTEQFSPVDLLKSCLKNCRKNANNVSKNRKYSAAAVEEANNTELTVTKAIIKCVEDHKLELQYPTEGLKKRVVQMEKTRAEKRRSVAPTGKPLGKRSQGGGGRSSGPPSFRSAKSGRFSNSSPSFHLRNPNPSQSHQASVGRYSAPYSYPSHGAYDGAGVGAASYGPNHVGAHAQSPAPLPPQYSYAPQDIGAAGARVGSSYGGQGSYGGQSTYNAYDYSAAAASAYPQ